MSSARKRQRAQRVAAMVDHANQQKMLAKHHADVMGAMAEEIARRHDAVRAALEELVYLKDIKEREERCWPGDPEIPNLRREYSSRKDAAWAAARAALEACRGTR